MTHDIDAGSAGPLKSGRWQGPRHEIGRWPARLLLIIAFTVTLPALGAGQVGGRGETVMDELRRRLDAIEITYARVAAILGEKTTEAWEAEALGALVVARLRAPDVQTSAGGGNGWPDDRMREVFASGDSLRDRILVIYSESGLDGAREVEAAVDEYLTGNPFAVAALPKSMDRMKTHRAPQFEMRHPDVAGAMWSAGWLQLAAFEPLLTFQDDADRAAGVTAIMMRYAGMLEGTGRSPTHMPMAPAIAPEFVTRHPRAAAIFDNLSLLRSYYLDLLVEGDENVAASDVGDLIADFADSDHMTIGEIEWIVMALRHGIYAQGGPAIGRLDRSERNDGGHHGAHQGGIRMPMPGM